MLFSWRADIEPQQTEFVHHMIVIRYTNLDFGVEHVYVNDNNWKPQVSHLFLM